MHKIIKSISCNENSSRKKRMITIWTQIVGTPGIACLLEVGSTIPLSLCLNNAATYEGMVPDTLFHPPNCLARLVGTELWGIMTSSSWAQNWLRRRTRQSKYWLYWGPGCVGLDLWLPDLPTREKCSEQSFLGHAPRVPCFLGYSSSRRQNIRESVPGLLEWTDLGQGTRWLMAWKQGS